MNDQPENSSRRDFLSYFPGSEIKPLKGKDCFNEFLNEVTNEMTVIPKESSKSDSSTSHSKIHKKKKNYDLSHKSSRIDNAQKI